MQLLRSCFSCPTFKDDARQPNQQGRRDEAQAPTTAGIVNNARGQRANHAQNYRPFNNHAPLQVNLPLADTCQPLHLARDKQGVKDAPVGTLRLPETKVFSLDSLMSELRKSDHSSAPGSMGSSQSANASMTATTHAYTSSSKAWNSRVSSIALAASGSKSIVKHASSNRSMASELTDASTAGNQLASPGVQHLPASHFSTVPEEAASTANPVSSDTMAGPTSQSGTSDLDLSPHRQAPMFQDSIFHDSTMALPAYMRRSSTSALSEYDGFGMNPGVNFGRLDPNNSDQRQEAMEAYGLAAVLKDVQIVKCIGKGAYGRVYKALWQDRIVAVKVIQHEAEPLSGGLQQHGSVSAAAPLTGATAAAALLAPDKRRMLEGIIGVSAHHAHIVETFKIITQPPAMAEGQALVVSRTDAQGLLWESTSWSIPLPAGPGSGAATPKGSRTALRHLLGGTLRASSFSSISGLPGHKLRSASTVQLHPVSGPILEDPAEPSADAAAALQVARSTGSGGIPQRRSADGRLQLLLPAAAPWQHADAGPGAGPLPAGQQLWPAAVVPAAAAAAAPLVPDPCANSGGSQSAPTLLTAAAGTWQLRLLMQHTSPAAMATGSGAMAAAAAAACSDDTRAVVEARQQLPATAASACNGLQSPDMTAAPPYPYGTTTRPVSLAADLAPYPGDAAQEAAAWQPAPPKQVPYMLGGGGGMPYMIPGNEDAAYFGGLPSIPGSDNDDDEEPGAASAPFQPFEGTAVVTIDDALADQATPMGLCQGSSGEDANDSGRGMQRLRHRRASIGGITDGLGRLGLHRARRASASGSVESLGNQSSISFTHLASTTVDSGAMRRFRARRASTGTSSMLGSIDSASEQSVTNLPNFARGSVRARRHSACASIDSIDEFAPMLSAANLPPTITLDSVATTSRHLHHTFQTSTATSVDMEQEIHATFGSVPLASDNSSGKMLRERGSPSTCSMSMRSFSVASMAASLDGAGGAGDQQQQYGGSQLAAAPLPSRQATGTGTRLPAAPASDPLPDILALPTVHQQGGAAAAAQGAWLYQDAMALQLPPHGSTSAAPGPPLVFKIDGVHNPALPMQHLARSPIAAAASMPDKQLPPAGASSMAAAAAAAAPSSSNNLPSPLDHAFPTANSTDRPLHSGSYALAPAATSSHDANNENYHQGSGPVSEEGVKWNRSKLNWEVLTAAVVQNGVPARGVTADALNATAIKQQQAPWLSSNSSGPTSQEQASSPINAASKLSTASNSVRRSSGNSQATHLLSAPSSKSRSNSDQQQDAQQLLLSFSERGSFLGTYAGLAMGSRRLWRTYIIQEFCDRGSLRDALYSGAFHRKVPEEGVQVIHMQHIMQTLLEVAQAMAYLHSKRLLHGDLHCANVLLQRSGTNARGFVAKLSDFGLARMLASSDQELIVSRFGTVSHMPPETIRDNVVVLASDAYSFGILMWEVYCVEKPFASYTPFQMLSAVVQHHERPQFPSHCPAEYSRLALECMATDYHARPPMAAAAARLQGMLTVLQPTVTVPFVEARRQARKIFNWLISSPYQSGANAMANATGGAAGGNSERDARDRMSDTWESHGGSWDFLQH